MEDREQRTPFTVGQWVAVAVFVGTALYLVIAYLAGADGPRLRRDALPLLFLVVLVGLVSVLLWSRDRSGGEQAREARAQAEAAGERAQTAETACDEAERRAAEEQRRAEAGEAAMREEHEARERVEERLGEVEQTLHRERQGRLRAERGRQAEKSWSRELRGQIVRLQRENGALSELDDLQSLVLRVATTLLEAEKGLLLAREDADGDGHLDLVASHGFDRDPTDSRICNRFASAVIEHDQTVREDSAQVLAGERGAAVDEEIYNLVAIPIYIQDEFNGVVVCANREGGFEDFDDDVLLALGDHAGAVLQNGRMKDDLRRSYVATVSMLAEALEAKDPFLRGHSDEVSSYVAAVSRRLEVGPGNREQLVFASLLHDVGKIGISERILLKPAALTPEERSVIELHPRIGSRLVQQVPALRPIAQAILHHHERYDGTGYPARLRGEEIPLEARIICVADSFSAMTADRPYRRRMQLEAACEELERCAGSQFDPRVVEAFVAEVRSGSRPEELDLLGEALDDPELQQSRQEGEPILGFGAASVVDSLTLLYSHRYLHEVAAREAETASSGGTGFAIALIELAELESINRDEGYAAGDAALRRAGRAVQRAAVQFGATAAREGGPRLGLLVPDADEAQGAVVAAEVVALLDGTPRVRTGIAAWRPGDGGDGVIERARRQAESAPLDTARIQITP